MSVIWFTAETHRTGGNVLENLKDPQGMHARLDKFVGEFRNPSTTLARPNIVGHDLVTDITCRKIIKLNPDVDLQF